ncbi:hypothetical protein BS50DRAFT_291124 [Corynespora cassiicola Philippines]|uniref:Uncharacterized protein n=1 Tax=Corynespora cassiicola Philippines TaxID=1448308 RepID=A0A2T2NVW0_CORCC|nr:hypothetical protein BS50DRAFT_291124 [Corynespora cassiicola Philippines]
MKALRSCERALAGPAYNWTWHDSLDCVHPPTWLSRFSGQEEGETWNAFQVFVVQLRVADCAVAHHDRSTCWVAVRITDPLRVTSWRCASETRRSLANTFPTQYPDGNKSHPLRTVLDIRKSCQTCAIRSTNFLCSAPVKARRMCTITPFRFIHSRLCGRPKV